MKFLFLGAGAVGTYIGGSLAARGQQVSVIENPAVAEVIDSRGLIVHRGHYSRTVRNVTTFTSAKDALAADTYDACVIAVKSFDTASAIDGLVETGLPVPTVVSVQNGVDNEAVIAERVGADNVIAASVTSAISKPGVAEVVEETHRGIGLAGPNPLVPRIAEALNYAGITTMTYPDAAPMKWSKLLTNIQGNATSAILDMPVGEIYTNPATCKIEMDAMSECVAVMRAQGFGPVDLPKTPSRALGESMRLPGWLMRPILSYALGHSRGDKMPSFHIDLRSRHTRTEVTWLNGAVVRHGAELGVPTPVNEMLTATLEDLSSGRQPLDAYRHDPEKLAALLG